MPSPPTFILLDQDCPYSESRNIYFKFERASQNRFRSGNFDRSFQRRFTFCCPPETKGFLLHFFCDRLGHLRVLIDDWPYVVLQAHRDLGFFLRF